MSVRFSLPEEQQKAPKTSKSEHNLAASPSIQVNPPSYSSPLLQSQLESIDERQHSEVLKIQSSLQHGDKHQQEDQEESEEQYQIREPEPAPTTQKNIMVMTGQGGIDLDDVFGFDQKQTQHRLTLANRFSRVLGRKHDLQDIDEGDLYQNIPKWFAYYILGQSVFIGSIMVSWISLIPSDKMLRISWRLLLQAIMLIPFVLYEHRNLPEKFQNCYNIKYIFDPKRFSKLFLAALFTGSQFAAQLYGFGWTHMAHSVLFLNITNFWLSVVRAWKNEPNNFLESAGRYMCYAGILTIYYDSMTFDPTYYYLNAPGYINNAVFFRQPWQRCLIGNTLNGTYSFSMSQLAKYTSDIKNIYPPFFSMFAINLMASINVGLYSYFVDGISLNNDPFWGYFGLSQDGSFTMFMYMSLLLSLGLFSSSVFITRLYEPVIPACSANLELMLNIFWLNALKVQMLPSAVAACGYLMVCPGQCAIIIGQHYLVKDQAAEKEKERAAAAAKPRTTNVLHPSAGEHRPPRASQHQTGGFITSPSPQGEPKVKKISFA